ncbi:MAG: hypothetical protein AAF202_11210 [Pseudomonadota bacterium]
MKIHQAISQASMLAIVLCLSLNSSESLAHSCDLTPEKLTSAVDFSQCKKQAYDQAEGYAVVCQFQPSVDLVNQGQFESSSFNNTHFEYEIRIGKDNRVSLIVFYPLWADDGPWTEAGLQDFLLEVQEHFADESPEIELEYSGLDTSSDISLTQVEVTD